MASQSFTAVSVTSLASTAIPLYHSDNEAMSLKILYPSILTKVNDPRIDPHPHTNVTAPLIPQRKPFPVLTIPPAPTTPTLQIITSPAPPHLLPLKFNSDSSNLSSQHNTQPYNRIISEMQSLDILKTLFLITIKVLDHDHQVYKVKSIHVV